MTKRILRMASLYDQKIDDFPKAVTPEFDRGDLLLSDDERQAKRTVEYIMAQPVHLTDDDRMVGKLRFNGCVEGTIYMGSGYKHCDDLNALFYRKPFESLCTFDAQHSNANFEDVLSRGMEAKLDDIDHSLQEHADDPKAQSFLHGLKMVIEGVLQWADKCASACEAKAEETNDPARHAELIEMARILRKVPRKPATTFREAIQSLYFMFQYLPDSLGTPDRYLKRYYRYDIEHSITTENERRELLQELFVMLRAFQPPTSVNYDRGGECHFAIGGLCEDGSDSFDDFSMFILDSLMDLNMPRPQISIRWTPLMPLKTFKKILDYERHDHNKRIVLVNDVPRVKMYMEHVGQTYEQVIKYCMLGCNEPSIPGTIYHGGCKSNVIRSLVRTLYDYSEECIACESFDEFFRLYRLRFEEDMDRFIQISDGFNRYRAKDTDFVSSMILNGPIQTGRSARQGGCVGAVAGTDLIGLVTLIDSLVVIYQFVYDEKRFTMEQLLTMIKANWEGFEAERRTIYKNAKYHGNDDPLSREISGRVSVMIKEYFSDKRNIYGYPFVIGTQIGYCPHHQYFGSEMRATPDGRFDGDAISFGGGQSGGRDRKGLTALFNSVADMDPATIICGPCVTNVMLDQVLISNDSYFDMVATLIDTYFRRGGLHLQLNYVSAEELEAAYREPEHHENLRVRVSGFSGFFTRLDPSLQKEIIARTQKTH
jgi:pyruvate-formate lyase